MRRIVVAGFAAALTAFGASAASRLVPAAQAQMPYACPGGTTLLCGTTQTQICEQWDQRTNSCVRWKTETLYYYHAKTGDGGGGGNTYTGDDWCSDPYRASYLPEQCAGGA